MIIWINGAFGADKSTLAAGLREALSGSVVTDPEEVGALLHQSMPGHPRRVRDYQKYAAWRRRLTTRLIPSGPLAIRGPHGADHRSTRPATFTYTGEAGKRNADRCTARSLGCHPQRTGDVHARTQHPRLLRPPR